MAWCEILLKFENISAVQCSAVQCSAVKRSRGITVAITRFQRY
jgi:hypothetical protein